MTSYELFNLHKEVITELSEIEKYISDIKVIAKTISESTDTLMQPLLKNLDQTAIDIANLERTKIIKSFNEFVNGFDMLHNHEILVHLKQNIENKKKLDRFKDFKEEFSEIDAIIKQIEVTTKKIYEYVKTKDAGILVQVLKNISETSVLYDKLETSFKQLETFIERLEYPHEIKDNEGYRELQFHFYNYSTSYDFCINNLLSVRSVYNELKLIFNIEGYELRVIKIESGSLLGKILGNENIIESLSYLLKKCIDLVFNKYTFEGQLVRKKELMEFLEKSAEFPEKCKELGLELGGKDTQMAKENISKAYAIISGEILKMATQSAKISIDNEVFSIQENKADKYLEEGKKMILTENTTA